MQALSKQSKPMQFMSFPWLIKRFPEPCLLRYALVLCPFHTHTVFSISWIWFDAQLLVVVLCHLGTLICPIFDLVIAWYCLLFSFSVGFLEFLVMLYIFIFPWKTSYSHWYAGYQHRRSVFGQIPWAPGSKLWLDPWERSWQGPTHRPTSQWIQPSWAEEKQCRGHSIWAHSPHLSHSQLTYLLETRNLWVLSCVGF